VTCRFLAWPRSCRAALGPGGFVAEHLGQARDPRMPRLTIRWECSPATIFAMLPSGPGSAPASARSICWRFSSPAPRAAVLFGEVQAEPAQLARVPPVAGEPGQVTFQRPAGVADCVAVAQDSTDTVRQAPVLLGDGQRPQLLSRWMPSRSWQLTVTSLGRC